MPRVAKTPLTRAEHDTIGHLLVAMHRQLSDISNRVNSAMPRTGSNPRAAASKAFARSIDALSAARNALDSELYRVHNDACEDVYFPGLPIDAVTLPVRISATPDRP